MSSKIEKKYEKKGPKKFHNDLSFNNLYHFKTLYGSFIYFTLFIDMVTNPTAKISKRGVSFAHGDTHTHTRSARQNVFFQEQFYYLVFVITLRVSKKSLLQHFT